MANFHKIIVLLILCNVLPSSFAVLKVGFYAPTCPKAEAIVRQLVQARFASDKSITAALLRMHFHDCFVRGCDASILLDSTATRASEKEAGPNLTVRGFELIDQIKAALETGCPNTVSCSDIVTLATRDAVALAGGPAYAVPTGRRDGIVSNVADVNLPGPDFTVGQARRVFSSKGLTLSDMVTLLGAHTVGVAHCSFFSDRLANFQGTGLPDPTMSPVLVNKLTTICNPLNGDPTVFLDQNTSFVFDNEYYHQLQLKKGILTIDQELALDASSAGLALAMARNATGFKQIFANAMIKMGGIQVLVGSKGQIRKNCRVVNPKPISSPPPPKPISSPPPPKPISSPPPPKPISTPPPPKPISSPPPPKPISPPPPPKTVSPPPKQISSQPPPLKL